MAPITLRSIKVKKAIEIKTGINVTKAKITNSKVQKSI
jgi:hypothetical protein